jgi:regulator of sirC expression with transglutaminase-like and TPR domain
MNATDRFVATVSVPAGEVRLDVAALCIAAHEHPRLDIDEYCARLDELAQRCSAPTFDGVREMLFERERFSGNTGDYADPENAFLDSVLDRRLGIPITLAVVMIEVARRIGVKVAGVGMPGHFLVRDPEAVDAWCDPFRGGAMYDRKGCRALFARLHGPEAAFRAEFLEPISAHALLARMLTNLERGRFAVDPARLRWLHQLHLALPGLEETERARLQSARRAVRASWN